MKKIMQYARLYFHALNFAGKYDAKDLNGKIDQMFIKDDE